MKTRFFRTPFIAAIIGSALAFSVANGFSETPPNLSLTYGTANVLKLAQAKVGDETIIAYIEKSSQSYGNLGADQIIYLRDQGVSDRVVTTMLNQEKNLRDADAARAVAQQNAVAAATPVAPAAPVVATPQYAPNYVAPTYTYVEPAPLIVMRDSSPRLVDYGIYPRYGFYPAYGYRSYGYSPNVSFSVGFGGYHSGVGFRGRYCR